MRISLTEIAEDAVAAEFAGFPSLVHSGALWPTRAGFLQEAFHIVVDVIPDAGGALLLHEESYRGGSSGDYDFVDIAHSKCGVSIRTGMGTRHVPVSDRLPGETEYWGSIVRPLIVPELELNHRLVIAGSGYRSEIDEAICVRIYVMMIALIEAQVRDARESGDNTRVEIVF